MWEKTGIDETVMIPVIPNDAMADKMGEETEAERLSQARQRGITIGMAMAIGVLAVCLCGAAVGSFLTRVLVL